MIKMSPPARSLIFGVVFFLFLSIFSFSTTNAHSCTEGFLSEAKRRNLVVTFCKRYQESNGVEIAMKLKEKPRRLDIMVGAMLEEGTGWLAWGLNPGPEARMVGTQALIGIKNKSNLLWDTYNITTYTKFGCQLLPSPIDLNISNFNFSYIDYLQYHVIKATIVLDPLKYDVSRLNHVWQVGVDVDAVGKEPKMHAKALRNYDSTETINLMTGKGRGNRVHTSNLIRQVHGVLNIIGWGTLLPIGVLIARNFREYPLPCSGWKSYHISCQSVGYIVGSAGWAVGIWLGKASKYYSFPKHGIFGICIFTFATLQMLFLKLKPDDESKCRDYRNMFHHVLGYSLLVVSCINIVKGLRIMYLDENYWVPAYFGVAGCLAFIFLVFEIVSWFNFLCDKFQLRVLCDKDTANDKANSKKVSRDDGKVQPSDTPKNN
ncbi:cytochrome b561 and DOMON domain-containing protein At5g35735-like [Nicotiana tomentosiformis]|uniref:cytochrome b561 and DOMON domain-containing protein At5g35735-like n=1 Tax=Nicotiana tomentosiformis TaxID=4098 RepID=UPI00051BD7DD|nr:cytochrome b561 and DOMON domain-containing protein At5g35735-like [Nicotiana tomentosiformis]